MSPSFFLGAIIALHASEGHDADDLPPWFIEAFEDVNAGLTFSTGASSKGRPSGVTSASTWSSNLPLGLYLGKRTFDRHKQGVLFKPGHFSVLCAYPVDAYSIYRQNVGPAKNSTLPPQCGVDQDKHVPGMFPWKCNGSAQEYVAKFYNWPLEPAVVNGSSKYRWRLGVGTCHFDNVSTMLQAQQALLQRSITPPPGVSKKDWDVRLIDDPTIYNEVVIGPIGPDAVAGIFWAHTGAFRKPQKELNDTQACIAAQNLRDAGRNVPVFEFANLPFEWHFSTESLKAWSQTLQAGGHKLTDHFRLVNTTEFLEVLDTDLCTSVVFV